MTKQLTDKQIEECRQKFDRFDKSGDGFISASEIAVVMRATGANPTNELIENMIKDMDTNGDKKIDFPEFLTYMARYNEQPNDTDELREAFAKFDRDNSGKISARELEKMMVQLGDTLTEEEVKEMIRLADADKSGDIDYNEFVKMLQEK